MSLCWTNTQMMKLFLDDKRWPLDTFKYTTDAEYKEEWRIVRSHGAFVDFVIKHAGRIDVVSFDHDLGEEHYRDYVGQTLERAVKDIELDYDNYKEKTGYESAKFLIEHYRSKGLKLPRIKVHSMNIVGAQNIRSLFK